MTKGILIVDYGMANLRSVQKAFEKVGAAAEISGDPARLAKADKIVLPGVGAFRDAIAKVRQDKLDRPLLDHIAAGKPFFGICLGLQLLFEKGYEDGVHEGLGVFRGDVVRFKPHEGLKIPHMGWNQLSVKKPAPQLADVKPGDSVYFVHAYYPQPQDESVIATTTDYPTPFASAVWKDNVFATQFHPEKSQGVGLTMLKHFAAL